jgi:hypothetical protein
MSAKENMWKIAAAFSVVRGKQPIASSLIV